MKQRSTAPLLFGSALLIGIFLGPAPLYSAQTILTGVPRPGISEKVRTFIINSVTDARCVISASGFEEQPSTKALADCRQKHMVLAPVIDVGAKLAIAMENKLRQSGASESAIKNGVKRRLQAYDGCVRNEIGPRQTLPLEGLAQLCAVSKTGSPKDGVTSMVTQEKSDTKISVYDFDDIIFDSLIAQQAGASAPSEKVTQQSASSCPPKTCNRCRALGFSPNFVAALRGGISRAFPRDAFVEGTTKASAKVALKESHKSKVAVSLKKSSPDLTLDDIWYVKDKAFGELLCMACPLGYVSNGINACVRDGCELGDSCRWSCPEHQIRDLGGNCLPACEFLNGQSEQWIEVAKKKLAGESGAKLLARLESRLRQDKEACTRDGTINVSDPQDYITASEGAPGNCPVGQVRSASGCTKFCLQSEIYPGSMEFGSCPRWFVQDVIVQIFEERGKICNTPITAPEIRNRIAESGFNCEAYAKNEKRQSAEPSSADSKQRPE